MEIIFLIALYGAVSYMMSRHIEKHEKKYHLKD